MCGRYALVSSADLLAELFSISGLPDFAPRYNIAPTQDVPVVRPATNGGAPGRRLDFLKWGLIPSWAKDAAIGNRMINARSETAAGKPSFRSAIRKRRCLVPVDAFYEWKKMTEGKQPYAIRMADEAPFALAGLWESWRDPAGGGGMAGDETAAVESFTILTTAANEMMKTLHDRMPVIVAPEDFARWLDPGEEDPGRLVELFEPFAPELMTAYPVSRRVNKPANDDASCLEAVEIEEEDAGGGNRTDDDEPSLFG